MIGLIIAIIIFNSVAFITNKRLTKNQIVHIWAFTIAFQILFDGYIDQKYHGYWYFTPEVDWASLPALTILVPAVNMMFLNWYPFEASLSKKVLYYFWWLIALLGYEVLMLLPEPWGYFNYGWWNLGYSALIDPFLLLIMAAYYKWISKLERDSCV
jgi:hypothetical protein